MRKFILTLGISFVVFQIFCQHSVARQWNEELLEAIRNDFARPTVHARNLFHSSIAMYDIWAVVTGEGQPYLLGDTVGTYVSHLPDFELELTEDEQEEYLHTAISYAMYELLSYRFEFAAEAFRISFDLDRRMTGLGYRPRFPSGEFPDDLSAVAFGRFVAQELIQFGHQDGANELNFYRNEFYRPINDPLLVISSGNEEMLDPNRWQPLAFNIFIDQSGNQIVGNIPPFLSPEWGTVTPFALKEEDLTIYKDQRQNEYWVYKDPGAPPYLSDNANDPNSGEFTWGFLLVAIWSSMLDPADGVMWDISPRTIGNIPELPESFPAYRQFYNLYDGGDPSLGRDINPVTGEPYPVQMVPRADYARVLAEFWADGPDSETPPGHWYTILHEVMDHPLFERRWQGSGAEIDELEYDLKAFFTLGGAVHDAAVATWGIKGWYDYVRPVSVIRYMSSKGQSTDPNLFNYDPHGLPLVEGYIETIQIDDPLAQADPSNVGKIKIKAWRGPAFIENPEVDVGGVGWILGEAWWPYQRPTFVSPPFAGYTSGHSCFSRAAAEVLTMMTGDEYFPGGVGNFEMKKDDFLVFERGPSVDMALQWATYRDASDQTSLSRIWGGIHPPQDDIPGRLIGIEIGIEAFNKANEYFGETTTSVESQQLSSDLFKVYPTLLTQFDRIHVSSDLFQGEDVRVELYDYQAKRVRSEKIRPQLTSLDLFGLKPGKYLLHLITKDKLQIEEVVIIE